MNPEKKTEKGSSESVGEMRKRKQREERRMRREERNKKVLMKLGLESVKEKMCVVLKGEGGSLSFHVFPDSITSLRNGAEKVPKKMPKPVLVLPRDSLVLPPVSGIPCGGMAFAILRGGGHCTTFTLYLIGGTLTNPEWIKKRKITQIVRPFLYTKEMYSCPILLDGNKENNTQLQPPPLMRCPSMASPKDSPGVRTVNNRKLFVFSQRLFPSKCGTSNFEVFDAYLNQWSMLPEICEDYSAFLKSGPGRGRGARSVHVHTCFAHNSKVFISLAADMPYHPIAWFVIDLTQHNPTWTPLDVGSLNCDPYPSDPRVARFLRLNPNSFFTDISSGILVGDWCVFPFSSALDVNSLRKVDLHSIDSNMAVPTDLSIGYDYHPVPTCKLTSYSDHHFCRASVWFSDDGPSNRILQYFGLSIWKVREKSVDTLETSELHPVLYVLADEHSYTPDLTALFSF